MPAFRQWLQLGTIVALAALLLCATTVCAQVVNNTNLQTVTFAQSVILVGATALEGIQYRDGILAAFQEFNDDPRPDKRFQLQLLVKDDGGDGPRTLANVQQFIADRRVIGILGLLGTTGTDLASPVAHANGLAVIAPYGGTSLRFPFQRYMVNLRGSYYDEAAALTEYLVNTHGRKRIALFVVNSTFGYTTHDGTVAALDSNNLYLHSYTFYNTKGNITIWTKEATKALDIMQATVNSRGVPVAPDGIVLGSDYGPAAVFIQLARKRFPDTLIACLSRVAVTTLISLIVASPTPSDVDGVFVSEVVPLPTETRARVVREYQAAMLHSNKSDWAFSGFEGYLIGRLAIQALDSIPGLNFTKDRFIESLYRTSYFNLNGLRVGPFTDHNQEDIYVSTGSCNQGMRQVGIETVLPNKSLAEVSSYAFDTCGYKTRTWKNLVFGQSCSFNASLSTLCVAFRDGLLAAFKEVNDKGGIRGTTRLKLITKEDNGDITTAIANNQAFLDDPQVLGLVGTSPLGIDQVVAKLVNRTDKFMLGAFGGDAILRQPFQRNIVSFRASVQDEIFAIVHHCYYKLDVARISALHEATSAGAAHLDQLQVALDEKRLELCSHAAYTSTNLTESVAALFARDERPQAVVFLGSDNSLGDVVEEIHTRDRDIMVFGLSMSMNTRLLASVSTTPSSSTVTTNTTSANATSSNSVETSGNVNWEKLMVTACVPDVTNQSIKVVEKYTNSLMDFDNGIAPTAAGLEGYVVGQMLAISLNGIMGGDLSVPSLLDSIYDHGFFKVDDLRCGPLADAADGSACSQCMKEVYLVGHNDSTTVNAVKSFAFDTCMYEPTANLDLDLGGSRLILVVLASIGIVYTLLVMLLLVKYRENPHVRPISVRFSLVSCLGGVFCLCGVLLLYPIPTDSICAAGPWVLDLSFVTLFGPIFAKTYRIDKILNHKKLKRQVISDLQVFRVFLGIVLVFAIFLTIYTIVDPPQLAEDFTYENLRFETCESHHAIFQQIDMVLKALVLIWGCFLCQRVFKIKGQFARFNESKQLVLCIYHTTFLAICLLLISLTANKKPSLYYACVASLVTENTVMVVSVLYARPVVFAMQNRELVSSETTGSGSTRAGTGPGQHGSDSDALKARAKKYKMASGKVASGDSATTVGSNATGAGDPHDEDAEGDDGEDEGEAEGGGDH